MRKPTSVKRWWLIAAIFLLVVIAIVARLVHLHAIQDEFLTEHSKARSVRVLPIHAPRGEILDRHGQPLAVSTKVMTLWIDPSQLNTYDPRWQKVLNMIHMPSDIMAAKLKGKQKRRFFYLKRQVSPSMAKQVLALKLPGVYEQTTYKRFYPEAEASAQLLGVTNIDDQGQAGLEQVYNAHLAGQNGQQRIVRDLKGHVIKQAVIKPMQPGKPIQLSIDHRLQFITYRALKHAYDINHAKAASAVIMDVRTGEILAMVSLPSFNPNDRSTYQSDAMRLRAVTDTFEPGSVMKPLAMAAVLSTGQYDADDTLDTTPGRYRVQGHIVRDGHNLGVISLRDVIRKSSNVGISKLVLSVQPETLPSFYRHVGLGRQTGVRYPGERSGVLPHKRWSPFALATLSFGYGISVTTLQLATAYATLANEGKKVTPTLLKQTEQHQQAEQIVDPNVAQQVLEMLTSVVQRGGTGVRARVEGFQVAGKTGTARKAGPGGYLPDSYTAIFAGVIPADHPQYAMVVMVDDPRGDRYYGGSVAAPVFSKVMSQYLLPSSFSAIRR